jgi:hypothetical protein
MLEAKYGGLDASEAQELKQLRENAAEEAGGRLKPGQRHATVGDPKKCLRFAVRRAKCSG